MHLDKYTEEKCKVKVQQVKEKVQQSNKQGNFGTAILIAALAIKTSLQY